MLYSLLVGTEPSGSETEDYHVSSSRFLEYTSGTIAPQFSGFSIEGRVTLVSWPCLCMAEGRGEEKVIVGQITAIDPGGATVVATVKAIDTDPPLTNDSIWRLREALDIEQFEFHRHHWAIKERDLLGILAGAGVAFDPKELSRFGRLPMPAPLRKDLLQAKQVIGDWGHTEITDLILEAGISDLTLPPGISRRDRANAILQYIFEHPSAVTAEGSLLSAFFARKAGLAPGAPPEPPAPAPAVPHKLPAAADRRASDRVFVVHGTKAEVRTAVVEFLRRHGLQGIVLNEQPNMGRHLLTKFIQEAALTTFAIVLLTDDDVGGKVGEELAPRARQNVILELGYFLSHLGQHRVCALKTPGLQTPSDFDGIVYIAMDEAGKWQDELYRELVAAELPVRSP